MNKKDEINSLVDQLKHYNDRYYNYNESVVPDAVYDNLLAKLKNLEQQFPQFLRPDSPTQTVGAAEISSTFEKVPHEVKMLSLDNAFSVEDINKFKIAGEYIVQPKLDGLALSVIFEDGKIVRAVTRGDGEIGEDVTENAKRIKNMPNELLYKGKVELRGEVIITNEDFKGQDFANQRNAASGAMRLKNATKVMERKLTFFVYDVISDELGITHEEQKEIFIDNLGTDLTFVPMVKVSQDEIFEGINKVTEDFTTKVPLDGAVIKLNSIEEQKKLGFTSKFPKWAIAYKFPAEAVETRLKRIFATVGRTGKITYNAELDPIEIDGSLVGAATLHNKDYIQSLDIREGDIVKVIKAGEIIPKVMGPVLDKPRGVKWVAPTVCPKCGQPLENRGNVDVYCNSPKCSILPKLSHFVSREAMNIDGLSERTLETLKLESFMDIYRLTESSFEGLSGFGETSIKNILTAVENSKNVRIDKFINALGIPLIGKGSAKKLAETLARPEDLLGEIADDIEDFGFEKYNSLVAFLKENREMVIDLLNILNIEMLKPKAESNGITVVITGSFDVKRPEIKEMLESLGFKVSTSISSKTDYLICGKNVGETKLEKVTEDKRVALASFDEIKEWAETQG